MRTTSLLAVCLLISCTGDEPNEETAAQETGEPAPDDTAPDDTDPGETGEGETGETGDTAPPEDPPSADEIAWTVHEEIGSIIQVSWQQSADAQAQLRFGVVGEDLQEGPSVWREAGPQEALILGVPYGAEIEFQIALGDEAAVLSDPVTAATDPLPEGFPVPTLDAAQDGVWDTAAPWFTLGVSTGSLGDERSWKTILDRAGRAVWIHETVDASTSNLQVSRDGADLLWEENPGKTSEVEPTVHRMKIDGTITETLEITGMHHAFIELDPGTLAWIAEDEIGRDVLRVREPGGEPQELWDCTAFWNANGGSARGCDGNGLFWNADDETIYYSSDNHTSVAEVDRNTGAVVRYFGSLIGAWGFAEGSESFWKQHAPTRTPEGNFMVSSHFAEGQYELVAREYELDEEQQLLREIWSCGEGSGIEVDHRGEARRLPNGNTLMSYGPGSRLREYTPSCEIAWDLAWPDDSETLRAGFLEDLYALAP